MQFPIPLVKHRTRKMGADIAIGNQSMARQVNQNTLRIFVRKVEDLPLVLSQLSLFRNGYRRYVGPLWQSAKNGKHARCQKERTRTGEQEA